MDHCARSSPPGARTVDASPDDPQRRGLIRRLRKIPLHPVLLRKPRGDTARLWASVVFPPTPNAIDYGCEHR